MPVCILFYSLTCGEGKGGAALIVLIGSGWLAIIQRGLNDAELLVHWIGNVC